MLMSDVQHISKKKQTNRHELEINIAISNHVPFTIKTAVLTP
jgi:hypothetical protein